MSIICSGNVETGKACTAPAKDFGGIRKYCGRHHAIGLRSDAAYRATISATDPASLKIAENARFLANLGRLSSAERRRFCGHLLGAWHTLNIPTFDIPIGFTLVCFSNPSHPAYQPVLRAMAAIYVQKTNHPRFGNYAEIPLAERGEALHVLHEAIAPFGLDPREIVRVLHEQHAIVEERVVRARLHAFAAAQVVRDPEGGIDLRAFAADTQSVHRSSVQNAAVRAIAVILRHPVADDQRTIQEISHNFATRIDFQASATQTSEMLNRRVVREMTQDYNLTSAFEHTYAEVLDHVWAFIRAHKEKPELVVRLAQEISEGIGMCSNGKMSRLLNVVQGYDESLVAAPPREAFQSAIARLMSNPIGTREAAARALFTEYQIPAEEHAVWLEPLLEQYDL
jgi:hypothetical protein